MAAVVDRHSRSGGQGQGMNFVRKDKRLAIYLRDGMACCYCGATVEDGARLTLDHLVPHSHGGSHHETNLVTCCHQCNSSRGNRSVEAFAAAVAGYRNHGVVDTMILDHIQQCIGRPLDRKAAKAVMAKRASWAECLKA